MLINKNASKRFSTVLNISRTSIDLYKSLSTLSEEFIKEILRQLLLIIWQTSRKKITVYDLHFLAQIANLPFIFSTTKIKHHFNISKNNFQKYIRTLTDDYDVKLSKNLIISLQFLLEQHLYKILKQAKINMLNANRKTLLPEDISPLLL